MTPSVIAAIIRNQRNFHSLVPFVPETDKVFRIDLSEKNKKITAEIFNDTQKFTIYMREERIKFKATYLIGGYNELRTVYSRSALFSSSADNNKETVRQMQEPRRLHLGIDIWGEKGTPVFAPVGGMVHSFAFNAGYGDYGATLILLHQLDGIPFYTLYGHLSMGDIHSLNEGQYISRGDEIAHFGEEHENGHWPPHLHFQVIINMELNNGDYPGVCRFSEREKYLTNCPDPDLILQMDRYVG